MYFGKPFISGLKIGQVTTCFELDHFVRGRGWEKVIRILIGGKVVAPKDGVIAWILFIFTEAAVLGTKGRQLGGQGDGMGGSGEKRGEPPEDFPGRSRQKRCFRTPAGYWGGSLSSP